MAKKYWNDEVYYSQPTTAELQRNMEATAEKARQKGRTMHPIIISGREIAKSWWGKAWCDNLGRYADYSTRLPRGMRYVRTGCVVDLQIKKGIIQAKVQGTRRTPYNVEIRISPLSEEKVQQIIERCSKRIESLESLVTGTFPEEMKDVFTGQGGLFPTPQEITFRCSCPDWALMCKHVAAVLYGVGARLDEDPLMFFSLRGIDQQRFTDLAISNRIDRMLENVDRPSGRIITGADLSEMFGVL